MLLWPSVRHLLAPLPLMLGGRLQRTEMIRMLPASSLLVAIQLQDFRGPDAARFALRSKPSYRSGVLPAPPRPARHLKAAALSPESRSPLFDQLPILHMSSG